MPMTPAQARARAQKAARKRHHGEAADTSEPDAVLQRAQVDKHITELVDRIPTQVTWRPAPEDRAALQRLLQLLFGATGGDGDGAAA